MPLFRYQAFDHLGKNINGELDASNESELKDILKSKNLILYKINKSGQGFLSGKIIDFFGPRVDAKSKIQFTNQLSILLRAGVPLLDAIDLLIGQFSNPMKKILVDIKEELKEGVSLADALSKYSKIFSNVYIQLVKAGEASGSLELVLDRMTTFLERTESTKTRITKALRPIYLQIFVMLSVTLGAITFIIPMMSKMLTQMGKALPPITQFMLDLSDFFQSYGILLAGFALILFIIFNRWASTHKGKVALHSFFLKIPKVSEFSKNNAVMQFSETLGMLLDAGANLPQALDIVNKIIENAVLEDALTKARLEIIKEGKIAKHLEKTNMFLPVSIYMIKTGEKSGNLAKMLKKVGSDAEIELVDSLDNLIAMINPVMMIFVGVLVLFIVLSIFLPIVQMSDVNTSF